MRLIMRVGMTNSKRKKAESLGALRANKQLISCLMFSFLLMLFIGPLAVRPAFACFACSSGDTQATANLVQQVLEQGENNIKDHTDMEFENHQDYLANEFYENMVKPALQKMTRQFVSVMMNQAMIIGMFFDAKQQLETQQLYQELQFEAHKDYQPSKDFCYFGTNIKSLAASEAIAKFNAASMSQRQLERQLGLKGTAGAVSNHADKMARWTQFKADYCLKTDANWKASDPNNTGLSKVCESGSSGSNADISYNQVVGSSSTVDMSSQSGGSMGNPDLVALGNNLFGHNVPSRKLNATDLSNFQNQRRFLALRGVTAKRAVAESSFNTVLSLKSGGSGGSSDTMQKIVDDLSGSGLPSLGANPSYFAQLEVMAKRIYQDPSFYAGLYDKPANVLRKSAALKAIELILDRAIYESQIRQEMSMSVLLSSQLEGQFRTIGARLEGNN